MASKQNRTKKAISPVRLKIFRREFRLLPAIIASSLILVFLSVSILYSSFGNEVGRLQRQAIEVLNHDLALNQPVCTSLTIEALIIPGLYRAAGAWEDGSQHIVFIRTDGKRVQAIVESPQKVFTSDRYTTNLESLQRIVDLNPESISGHTALGLTAYYSSDFQTAITHFETAFNLDLRSHHHAENTNYSISGLPVQAMMLLTGVSYGMLDQYNSALEYLNQSLELVPTSSSALFAKSLFICEMGSPELAKPTIELLMTQSSDSPTTLHALSLYHRAKNNRKPCLELLNRVIDLDEGQTASYLATKSETLLEWGQPEAALKAIEQALMITKDPQFYVLLGRCYVAQEKYTAAELSFKQAFNMAPNYAEGYYELGKMYEKLGRLEFAQDNIAHSRELGFRHPFTQLAHVSF